MIRAEPKIFVIALLVLEGAPDDFVTIVAGMTRGGGDVGDSGELPGGGVQFFSTFSERDDVFAVVFFGDGFVTTGPMSAVSSQPGGWNVVAFPCFGADASRFESAPTVPDGAPHLLQNF